MLNQSKQSPVPNLSRIERRLAKKNAKKENAAALANRIIETNLNNAIQVGKSGETDVAKGLFIQLMDRHQNIAAVQYYAGVFFEQNKMQALAYVALKNAVTLDPTISEYWTWFGIHLMGVQQNAATVIACQRASALSPGNADLLCNLAKAHAANDDLNNALLAIDVALSLRSDHAMSLCQKGAYLNALGEFDLSRDTLYAALDVDPDMVVAYSELVRSGAKIRDPEKVLARLQKKLETMSFDDAEYVATLFVIAKLEDQRKNYSASFSHYAKANQHLHDRGNFKLEQVLETLDSYQKFFRAHIFDVLQQAGADTELPVFIVGMPRSGTTLVEQVIASHSQAASAGEANKMGTLTRDLMAASDKENVYPRNILNLNPQGLAALGEEYVAFLQKKSPGNWRRIVDKMPFNYIYLGLIKVLFPKAAIIHCKRDPLDTCVSNFTTRFTDSNVFGFSNDLETLGNYYNGYERLMEHWHDVLPGQILDVRYEDMTDDPEMVSRKIIKHIGLDWEDGCLQFHKNKGGVQTASVWQVRQPIYKTSVERWRRYEKYLGPLQQALKNH